MSARSDRRAMAEAAAQEAALASEAGRVLQQRAQESKQATVDPVASEPDPGQKDQNDQVPRVKARNEQRRLAVEEVENAYQARLEEQMKKPGIQEFEPEPKPETPAAPQQAKPEEKPAEPQDTVPGAQQVTEPVVTPPVETVRVKVDGEEFDAPKAEVDEYGGIRPYQIAKAADKKLREAKEIFAEARKMQDGAVSQALRVLQQNQQPPQPQVNPATLAIQKAVASRFGTDEEFAAAMQEFASSITPKPQDQNIQTYQTIAQVNRHNATNSFKSEFADIVSNPLLLKLSATLENERLSQLPQDPVQLMQFDWTDFYRRIGNEVRSVAAPRPHQSQPNAATPPSTTTGHTSQEPSDKEARKSSIVNLPTAAARATPPAEDKPVTYEQARAQALLDVAKARGKYLA